MCSKHWTNTNQYSSVWTESQPNNHITSILWYYLSQEQQEVVAIQLTAYSSGLASLKASHVGFMLTARLLYSRSKQITCKENLTLGHQGKEKWSTIVTSNPPPFLYIYGCQPILMNYFTWTHTHRYGHQNTASLAIGYVSEDLWSSQNPLTVLLLPATPWKEEDNSTSDYIRLLFSVECNLFCFPCFISPFPSDCHPCILPVIFFKTSAI